MLSDVKHANPDANSLLRHARELMNSNLHFAASCVLRILHNTVDEKSKPITGKLLVHCGIQTNHHDLIRNYIQFVDEGSHIQNVSRLLLSHDTHTSVKERVDRILHDDTTTLEYKYDTCGLVCAGGTKLLLQLWCNLKSLQRVGFKYPVMVCHANEVDAATEARFKAAFRLQLVFVDLHKEFSLFDDARELHGFQIKLAAISCVQARRVLMFDADILWLHTPEVLIRDAKHDAHFFSDFWHFHSKPHERSATTCFLYNLFGVESNIQEFESGVVYMNRERCESTVKLLKFMTLNYKYFFNLTFGDKDLYYLAAKLTRVDVAPRSPHPKMLGTSDNDLFNSQSMVQFVSPDSPLHVHTTLHPIGDANASVPDMICDDHTKIEFVQRTLQDKPVGTVACDIQDATYLTSQSAYRLLYLTAFCDRDDFEAIQPGTSNLA